MNLVHVTIALLLTVILILVVYDIWVFKKTRNDPKGDATISHILLTVTLKRPIVGVLFGLAIGILMGHLWWPQHVYHCQ